MPILRYLSCILTATLSVPPVAAESTHCTLAGMVQDRTGSAVAGAEVTIRSVSGNTLRNTASDGMGGFQAVGLEPGTYEVAALKKGVGQAKAQLGLSPGSAMRLDLHLEPAPALDAEAILQELDTLRARIATLQSELTQQRAVASIPPPQVAPPPTVPAESSATVVENKPKEEPFSNADWTWLNGNPRTKDSPLDTKYFTGEFRADTHYGIDFNQPRDHTMGGSSEVFRSGEVQVEQISVGGDFHAGNVRGRILTMFGMFATTTPRNDASAAVGQWDARNAYRHVSEAWGGYHFNVNHGLNVDAGIFTSYVGLFSYYNFDNWAYQPSYVSSNTPWFFNGVRVQWFPTANLKIEPWFINGWQAYNRFNGKPGLGGQIKWAPKPWLVILGNQYAIGTDTLGVPKRQRFHTDNSIEVKYYENPGKRLNRMALTVTGDLGCETGGGVSCTGKGAPKQAFLGWMAYNRFWFKKDLWGLTLGGGQINNPGRYLVLVPPINGADAISGTPYFTANPGDKFKAYDATATFDYMPSQFITFRSEFGYRHSNVPYWSGRGGITPPGGNTGDATQLIPGWKPDLRKGQALLLFSILVKL